MLRKPESPINPAESAGRPALIDAAVEGIDYAIPASYGGQVISAAGRFNASAAGNVAMGMQSSPEAMPYNPYGEGQIAA